MKDKIKQEILDFYARNEAQSEMALGEVIDLVFDRATDAIFEEVKKEFKQEFNSGTLKHDFIISSDYYLDLKLKAVKEKITPSNRIDEDSQPDYSTTASE